MTNSGPGSQVASRDVLNQVLKDESVLVQRSRDHQQAGRAARADPRQTEGEDGPAGLCLSHPSRALPHLSSLQAQGCCTASSQVSGLQALPFPVGPVRRFLRRHTFKGAPQAQSHPRPAHMPPFPTSPRSPGCQGCPGPPHRPAWPPSAHGFVPRAPLPFHPSHPNQSGGPSVPRSAAEPRARIGLASHSSARRSGLALLPRFAAVQSLSHVPLSAALWTEAHQASLSFTVYWTLFRFMSIESVMPSTVTDRETEAGTTRKFLRVTR